MKTIAFITRVHPRRPNMLKRCIESVKMQTSDDYIHILHRDDNTKEGYGVPAANRSLMKVKPINARYVMILDDDNMLIDPNFVEIFANAIEKDIPEIVFFKGKIAGNHIFPRPEIWGKPPKFAFIDSFNFAARRDVWINNIEVFGKTAFHGLGGDFTFISSCYSKTKQHLWLDRIVAQTQKSAGRGQGEHCHV